MSVEYDLRGLHPSYGRSVEDVLDALLVDYPMCRLRRVTSFKKDGDLSRCDASTPGVIRLNLAWFGQPVEVLKSAASEPQVVDAGGVSVPWHGAMPEPMHLLTHEFGHQLQNALPWWRDFASHYWRLCCADAERNPPVSGYSLGDADEFFADVFAAMRLGVDGNLTGVLREEFEGR